MSEPSGVDVDDSHAEGFDLSGTGDGRPLVPVDAVVVCVATVVATGVLATGLLDSEAVRALLAAPLLFFLPGYGLQTALFPGRDAPVGPRARLSLSFGLSLALVPLVGVGMGAIGLTYRAGPIALAVALPTLAGTAVGVGRRLARTPEARFRLPVRNWRTTLGRRVRGTGSRLELGLHLLLVSVVVLSAAGFVGVLLTPNHAQSYSSLAVLAPADNGTAVAADYPDRIGGSGTQLIVRVRNDEGEERRYTVVGELQRISDENGSAAVLERREVLRSSRTVGPGRRWRVPHRVAPSLTGEDLRLTYYLYRGAAPAEPTRSSAYRRAYVWVDAGENVTG